MYKQKPRILIVDDNPSIRYTIRNILEAEGDVYSFQEAATGEAALTDMISFRPDLILLDVSMPGMDGYKVCKRIRCDEEFRYVSVVMITCMDSIEDLRAGYESGTTDYIMKPFDSGELVKKIKRHLELKSAKESGYMIQNAFKRQLRSSHLAIADQSEAYLFDRTNKNETKKIITLIREHKRRCKNFFDSVFLKLSDTLINPQKKILIVDDSEVNQKILFHILSDSYILEFASSGEEALEKMHSFQPYLIFLDVCMGAGIDGYEVCRRIRKHPKFLHVNVIMVSAKDSLEDRLEGYKAGATDYIPREIVPVVVFSKANIYIEWTSLKETGRLLTSSIKKGLKFMKSFDQKSMEELQHFCETEQDPILQRMAKASIKHTKDFIESFYDLLSIIALKNREYIHDERCFDSTMLARSIIKEKNEKHELIRILSETSLPIKGVPLLFERAIRAILRNMEIKRTSHATFSMEERDGKGLFKITSEGSLSGKNADDPCSLSVPQNGEQPCIARETAIRHGGAFHADRQGKNTIVHFSFELASKEPPAVMC